MAVRRTDPRVNNPHCPYRHVSKNCEVVDRIVRRFLQAPSYPSNERTEGAGICSLTCHRQWNTPPTA
jgi:hypothetical protein